MDVKNKKKVILTIDDCPSSTFNDKLSFLKYRKIPALLFCRGDYIEKRMDLVVNAIQMGYIIGNHGYDHQRFSKLKYNECIEQIDITENLIDKAHALANRNKKYKIFRFPFGDKGGEKTCDRIGCYTVDGLTKKNEIQKYLKYNGYARPNDNGICYEYYTKTELNKDIDWYWTYDVMEWNLIYQLPQFKVRTIGDVFKRIIRNEPEKMKGLVCNWSDDIVLIHDHDETNMIFNKVITFLISMGLKFESPI